MVWNHCKVVGTLQICKIICGPGIIGFLLWYLLVWKGKSFKLVKDGYVTVSRRMCHMKTWEVIKLNLGEDLAGTVNVIFSYMTSFRVKPVKDGV